MEEIRTLREQFDFRPIRPEEIDESVEIENICFPPNEACSAKHMRERAEAATELFLVAIDRGNGKMAGFLTGIATEETAFRDDFFTDISLHDNTGGHVMLLSLNVRPEYRGRGLARELLRVYRDREEKNGRKALHLTCHTEKLPMYEKMGFRDQGLSASVWGGGSWNDMEMVIG
ncbi:MAG: GNAT family N-acetyltransferase [Lachnospiraceae bacterium]|nr:GNAT family N-acetyltransferase [Lachnospiraceae bacterium]